MKRIKIFVIVLMVLNLISCKNYLDTNHDPNKTNTTRVDYVLSSAQLNMAVAMGGRAYEQLNVWNQYWSSDNTVSTGEWEKNDMTPGDGGAPWNRMYQNSLSSLSYIINSGNQPKYTAVAKLLMAYEFQVLVDLYGNVPFSDALKGADATPVRAPKVDNQEAIYAALIPMIDEGIRLLDTSGAGIDDIKGDLVFDGVTDNWKNFGNALKLRVLMRQSKTSNSSIASSVADLYNNVGLSGLVTDAYIQFSADPLSKTNLNPLYTNLEGGALKNHYNGSATCVSFLNSTSDPRLSSLYENSTLAGRPHGDQDLSGPYCRPKGAKTIGGDAYLYGPNVPFVLIASWETYFFLSEAAALGWISEDAQTLYNQGVQANFDYYDLGDASSYTSAGSIANQTGGAFDATDLSTMLKSIALQKWVCMNGIQPIESFNETRRSDNASNHIFATSGLFVTPPKSNLPAGVFPTLYYYSSTEVSLNPNVVQHSITDKTFWDK